MVRLILYVKKVHPKNQLMTGYIRFDTGDGRTLPPLAGCCAYTIVEDDEEMVNGE